jgi:3-isopropylmalate/(R)-2-methylmalate dehydratase small subunit
MANYTIHGKVHKYGDNINTDLISPARFIGMADDVMIAHAMDGVDPEFSNKVNFGDILVAGENFGSGSSRETAPFVIKESGISVIIAKFFARIFFRNAINIGLPVMVSDCIEKISDGDDLKVDPIAGKILNTSTGEEFSCSSLPDNIMQLVKDGGLIPHFKKLKK